MDKLYGFQGDKYMMFLESILYFDKYGCLLTAACQCTSYQSQCLIRPACRPPLSYCCSMSLELIKCLIGGKNRDLLIFSEGFATQSVWF